MVSYLIKGNSKKTETHTNATEKVWQEFRSKLFHFILSRVRDQHLAEDLLQETFLRIHNGMDSVKKMDRLQYWAFRIARNAIADHYRNRQPTVDEFDLDSLPEMQEEDNFNQLVAGWLERMIGQLPEKYGIALRMAEIEGITQQEVAERLSLSLSGAKSRVQRARRMLKGLLLACCHIELDSEGNVIDYGSAKCCKQCCQ